MFWFWGDRKIQRVYFISFPLPLMTGMLFANVLCNPPFFERTFWVWLAFFPFYLFVFWKTGYPGIIGRKNDCTFWSNRSFLVKYFVHNRGCKDFPFNPQISEYTTRKRVEVGNYPRALANFAKNIRPRKPYLRRALSVQQSA